MTPLAQRIVRELTLPIKRRTFQDDGGLLGKMDNVHCFEITQVAPLLSDLDRAWGQSNRHESAGTLAFLPAPKTWIEWGAPEGRTGFLLEEQANGAWAKISIAQDAGSGEGISIPLNTAQIRGCFVRPQFALRQDAVDVATWAYAALAVINTPRVIARRQHMPHRGLERALLKQQKLIGKFPLHAWTEIKLEVTPPHDASGDPPEEGHYTGRKALHFCRQHLRIRYGKLELVSSHWRGDPALGIKQSRYTVVPPKQPEV